MNILYLHGFASSPLSRKGVAYDEYLSARGHQVLRLDMRLPNRDQLRVSAMIEAACAHARERCVIIGSSLGGLVAAHVALREPAVAGVILMAPAFRFATRWADSLGAEELARWQEQPLEVADHAGGAPLQVDYGFYEDAAAIDTQMPRLSQRVLLFHGRRDDVVPIEGSRAFLHAQEEPAAVEWVELDDDHALAASIPLMLPRAAAFIERVDGSARQPSPDAGAAPDEDALLDEAMELVHTARSLDLGRPGALDDIDD